MSWDWQEKENPASVERWPARGQCSETEVLEHEEQARTVAEVVLLRMPRRQIVLGVHVINLGRAEVNLLGDLEVGAPPGAMAKAL